MRAALRVVALCLLAWPLAAAEDIGRRVALVIGNGAYERSDDRLENPANDARAMAAKLRTLDFEVIEAIDRDFRGMREALRQFERAMTGASTGLFFYAGHGMEYLGRNYLFPVDAVLETEGDIRFGLVEVAQVLRIMETSVPTRLVFLDACRNNPSARRLRSLLGGGTRSAAVGTGLARMEAGQGTYIAYATAPGDVAEDGDGRNSPFTRALLQHLDAPGLDVRLVMDKVRRSVLEATNRRQIPWETSSLLGPFVFNVEIAVSPAAPPASAADTLWAALGGSTSAEEWRHFATTFPDDPRSSLARLRAEAYAVLTDIVALPPGSAPQAAGPPGVPAGPVASAVPDPAAIERSLGLGRDDWRRVQASLAGLGHDPRGVDGRPGAHTRAAIRAWQRAQDLEVTGYLQPDQHDRLLSQAAAQLAMLEAARARPVAPAHPVVGRVEEQRRFEAGDVLRDCPHCPELVVVPAGSFLMGSLPAERDRAVSQGGRAEDYVDEGPVSRVTIASPFAVGRFEVTVGEFRRFVAATGHDIGNRCSTFEDGQVAPRSGRNWQNPGFAQTDRHPVACVSWVDAQAYVAWLRRETGERYRLLSEAEWEYAARAGTTTMRYWGDDRGNTAGCAYANAADAAAARALGWTAVMSCDDGSVHTSAVGRYRSNGFGLHDMQGNVLEWVEDRYHQSHAGVPSDGSARTTGQSSLRVLRGGSWYFTPSVLRAAFRYWSEPDARDASFGFRVARTLR